MFLGKLNLPSFLFHALCFIKYYTAGISRLWSCNVGGTNFTGIYSAAEATAVFGMMAICPVPVGLPSTSISGTFESPVVGVPVVLIPGLLGAFAFASGFALILASPPQTTTAISMAKPATVTHRSKNVLASHGAKYGRYHRNSSCGHILMDENRSVGIEVGDDGELRLV
ncbi:hypothetical protein RUND412_007570 [Rhizina undulata]